MNSLIVVPLAIFLLTSFSAAKSDVRIVGGTFAPIEKFPFVVVIRIRVVEIYEWQHREYWGGGSIIEPRWVITAAHVLVHGNVNEMEIAVFGGIDKNWQIYGSHDFTFKLLASAYFVHENYDYDTNLNDIALIKLPEAIKYHKRVGRIRLPRHKEEEYKYSRGTAVGFGKTHENNPFGSESLMQVDLDVYHDHKYCSLKQKLYDSKAMLCAGIKEGGKDTCFGDSGYPFVIRRTTGSLYLAGIISFGTNDQGCARSNTPAFYVRVSSYLDWINHTMDTNK